MILNRHNSPEDAQDRWAQGLEWQEERRLDEESEEKEPYTGYFGGGREDD